MFYAIVKFRSSLKFIYNKYSFKNAIKSIIQILSLKLSNTIKKNLENIICGGYLKVEPTNPLRKKCVGATWPLEKIYFNSVDRIEYVTMESALCTFGFLCLSVCHLTLQNQHDNI